MIEKGKYAQEVCAYVRSILDGEKPAGKDLLLACQRFERMCADAAYEVRTRDADFVIGIIETTFKHRQGQDLRGRPMRGKPFLLEPWEKFCVYGMLAFFKRGTNERVVKEGCV